MDSAKIKHLLEKYYAGETTPDEERALQAHFESVVDAGPDAELFRALKQLQTPVSSGLTEHIDAAVEKAWQHETRRRFIRRTQWAAGIAAALIIALLIPFTRTSHQKPLVADTFQTPEEACQKTREVLLFISASMNRQTVKLEHLSVIDGSLQKAGQLKQIDKSLNAVKHEND